MYCPFVGFIQNYFFFTRSYKVNMQGIEIILFYYERDTRDTGIFVMDVTQCILKISEC